MTRRRSLIVNADDFGQSSGVNEGVIHCHEQGIVTSASLMVRWPAAAAAAEYAHRHPRLSVGLHVDLGEWEYRNASWMRLYQVVAEDDAEGVSREVTRQLELFRELIGRDPTHLDSHQHAHLKDPLKSTLLRWGTELRIPVRHFSRFRYCGKFYGQPAPGDSQPDMLNVTHLNQILFDLPEGTTELGCHPGLRDDVNSMYRSERSVEVQTLCDPAVRQFLQTNQIELWSFHEAGG